MLSARRQRGRRRKAVGREFSSLGCDTRAQLVTSRRQSGPYGDWLHQDSYLDRSLKQVKVGGGPPLLPLPPGPESQCGETQRKGRVEQHRPGDFS